LTDDAVVGGHSGGHEGDGDEPKQKSFMGGYEGDEGGHDHGYIRFVTDTIKFDRSARVRTSGEVYFEPYSPGTTIGIAGAHGTLQLTETVLDDVSAGGITIGNTYRDWGKITADHYDWRAPVRILNGWGDIDIHGMQFMGDHTFLANTVWGDIIIGRHGGVISFAGQNQNNFFKTDFGGEGFGCGGGNPCDHTRYETTAITLAASNGRFLNFNDGPTLWAPNGRWLVYSGGPMTNVYGGLAGAEDFHSYSCNFNGMCWVKPLRGGNGFIYNVTPILSVTVDNKNIMFGDAPPVYTFSNAVEYYYFKGKKYFMTPEFMDTPDVHLFSIYLQGDPAGKYDINAFDWAAWCKGYIFNPEKGILTVEKETPPVFDLSGALERGGKAPGRRGPTGTLLAIVNNAAPVGGLGGLADLAPAAGGDNPQAFAELSPSAGGPAGITPLIQCNEATPCDINQ
jgi:hypothetical protein